MSQKVTSKNLTYSTTLPPFLARLRRQADASSASGPDPILAGRRRPVVPRADPDDDGPVVVDEEGNAVGGVSVEADGTVRETAGEEGREEAEEGKERAGREMEEGQAENTVAIGAWKKRKAGRVVGGDDGERQARREGDGNGREEAVTPREKSRKKTKKIKLSFGDEEG